jgi:hypothetical protein
LAKLFSQEWTPDSQKDKEIVEKCSRIIEIVYFDKSVSATEKERKSTSCIQSTTSEPLHIINNPFHNRPAVVSFVRRGHYVC